MKSLFRNQVFFLFTFVLLSFLYFNLTFSKELKEAKLSPPSLTTQDLKKTEKELKNNLNQIINQDLPVFKERYNFVIKRLFIDRKLYQILDLKKRKYLFTVKKLANMYLATYPKLLFLTPTLNIQVHKEFIVKVIFPYEIKKVIASANQFKILSFTENVLFIQGSEDLILANLEVFLQNGDKKEIVNVYVEGINPLVKKKPIIFYPDYLIIPLKILPPYKVLEFYKAKYDKLPQGETQVVIAGVPYLIKEIKDKGQANISIGDKDYYVSSLLMQ